MKSKLIAIRMPVDLRNKLLELARKDRRTFSAYMRNVLEDHVIKSARGLRIDEK